MFTIYTVDTKDCKDFLDRLARRAGEIPQDVLQSVNEILQNVKLHGDEALLRYTEQLDGVRLSPESLELPRTDWESAASQVDSSLYAALSHAAEHIRAYHEKQKRPDYVDTSCSGRIAGCRYLPVERAGIYVPGGSAAYPSTVLMDCIPARVAGVRDIVMTTPLRSGRIPPAVAAAALLAGVDRIFLCGGAQAIAALAYGTETIPRADVIAGPGNIYVATAKRLVYGEVQIDMIAGPSEILIIADSSADPDEAAADLLSQAEHDRLASALLLTDDAAFSEQVRHSLTKQLAALDRSEIAQAAIDQFGGAIVCRSIDQALAIANKIAPEHLELLTQNPLSDLAKVQNAGSVFLGPYSPEPLGDYFAGPNHVLPTNGTARFASPLSVDTFLKKSSFLYYDRDGLRDVQKEIICLAESEGLTAHANSVRIRFQEGHNDV